MKKAFTLIESMVVVAIVAILCAAIAGNVKYKKAKTKCKDRQVQGMKTQSMESTTTYTIISE